ncbi:MAG: phosphoribosylamine--glycine ligase [Ferruginibacter sp.]|nr:phosphoribosylamine--glycine ligase [Ferruginibacter sp.]
MNVLIIGSGGREHAIAWKIKQSPICTQIYVAPGNAGTSEIGINLPVQTTDFKALSKMVTEKKIGLMIVGPEEPLVKGIVDFFQSQPENRDLLIVGPAQEPAQLEGSKSFAKAFMKKYGIPTASYAEFTEENYQDGVDYIRHHSLPVVLKADGLAAGKGVIICNSHEEAVQEFEWMVRKSKFGIAGSRVVIESFLQGIEASVFVLTDGSSYVLLPEAKDYKRIGEADQGLNTGGMGAISPVPFFDAVLREKIIKKIVEPTIEGIKKEKYNYKGFVFIGLMIFNGEPFVIEYNCRMGDPETEVVIPRITGDLLELLLSAAKGDLGGCSLHTDPRSAATVVAVSGGYPEAYKTGKIISGLKEQSESIVFHSGTKNNGDEVLTNGGRVLAITSFGEDIDKAARKSYQTLEKIHFDDIYFRKDIGYEFK